MRARLLTLAVAAAVGIGGASCREGGSPNGPTPVCTFAISPATLTFGDAGGTGNVTVSAPAGCTWSVTVSASWITVTAGSSGNGPGTVAYAVVANATSDARTGTLTIAGQSHGVTQQGRPATVCSYALAPGDAQFSKDAATGTFTVTAPDGCAWTAASNTSWIVITSGSQGSGNGSVSYSVARNFEVADRSAAISVAGSTYTVRQAGDIGNCEYAVAPVALSPCMPAGTLTATITTAPNCPWTATPSVSWLTLQSGPSGTGSGNITFSFSDNYDAPRQGIVMVRWDTPTAGQNIHVAQAGCLYGVSRDAFSFASAGGSGAFDVIQQSDPIACGGATQDRCLWTAQSDVPWITITSSMPRMGDNPVAFTVGTNASSASRAGRITVRDRIVVITQAGQ